MVCGPPLPPLLQHCSNSSVVVVPLVLTGCHLFLFKVHGTPFDIDCSGGEFSEYDEKGECPVELSNLQSAFKVVSRPLHHLPANMVQFIYIIVAIARWKIDTTVIDNRWRSMRGVGRLDSSRPSDLGTVWNWNWRCIRPCLVPKIKIPNFFPTSTWRLKSRQNKKRIATAVCKWRDESNEPN